MNKIILEQEQLLLEQMKKEDKSLEEYDTCFKLYKIYKNFEKLEPYMNKAIREIESKEKAERERE